MVAFKMPLDHIIRVAEFSRYPGGRFRNDGDNSGQAFRDDVLVPALKRAIEKGGRVVVILDGTAGYASSFLEEAFGGLYRVHHFDPDTLAKVLVIKSEDPAYEPYLGLSRRYMRDASSFVKH